jgi:heat shock protein HslJ
MTIHGSAWRLERLGNPDADTPAVARADVTLRFTDERGDSGRLGGSGGCNRYFASYRIEGDRLHVGAIGSTKMFCPDDAVMEQEGWLFRALEGAERFTAADDRLVITGTGGTLQLRPIPSDEQQAESGS